MLQQHGKVNPVKWGLWAVRSSAGSQSGFTVKRSNFCLNADLCCSAMQTTAKCCSLSSEDLLTVSALYLKRAALIERRLGLQHSSSMLAFILSCCDNRCEVMKRRFRSSQSRQLRVVAQTHFQSQPPVKSGFLMFAFNWNTRFNGACDRAKKIF